VACVATVGTALAARLVLGSRDPLGPARDTFRAAAGRPLGQ
jgi:hypothetical protein